MAKSTFGDLSTSQSLNTSIDGNDASENCVMSGLNNIDRALAAMGKSLGTFVATTGTDTYLSTFAPVPDALATDFLYGVNIANANTSTTPTWNPSGFGPKTITDTAGNALLPGSLNGRHIFIYDGTNFRVLNPIKSAASNVGGPASSTDGDVALFSGTTGQLLKDSGFTLGTLFRSYLAGLTLSNDSVTPNTIIDIAAGTCTSDDNTTVMTTAAITKTTGAWAVGSGNGGLDTGAVANGTWYHVFIIKRTDTGVTDALISTSATTPTLPANYTKQRRIGSFKTDGSAHILAFKQFGDVFYWAATVADVSAVSIAVTTANLATLSVPSGVQVDAMFRGELSPGTSTNNLLFTSPDENDQVPAGGFNSLVAVGSGAQVSADFIKRTNTSGQVRWRASAANGSIWIQTYGWCDLRGRFS